MGRKACNCKKQARRNPQGTLCCVYHRSRVCVRLHGVNMCVLEVLLHTDTSRALGLFLLRGFTGPHPGCWKGGGQNFEHLDQGFLTGGKFPPWGKYWEFRGEMRAFENCCLFKTGDTKWFP